MVIHTKFRTIQRCIQPLEPSRELLQRVVYKIIVFRRRNRLAFRPIAVHEMSLIGYQHTHALTRYWYQVSEPSPTLVSFSAVCCAPPPSPWHFCATTTTVVPPIFGEWEYQFWPILCPAPISEGRVLLTPLSDTLAREFLVLILLGDAVASFSN